MFLFVTFRLRKKVCSWVLHISIIYTIYKHIYMITSHLNTRIEYYKFCLFTFCQSARQLTTSEWTCLGFASVYDQMCFAAALAGRLLLNHLQFSFWRLSNSLLWSGQHSCRFSPFLSRLLPSVRPHVFLRTVVLFRTFNRGKATQKYSIAH